MKIIQMIIVMQKKVEVIVLVFVKNVVVFYVHVLLVNQMKKGLLFQEAVVQHADQNVRKTNQSSCLFVFLVAKKCCSNPPPRGLCREGCFCCPNGKWFGSIGDEHSSVVEKELSKVGIEKDYVVQHRL